MKSKITRLEFMRIHYKAKKFWISIIALIITLLVTSYFAVYIMASKDSSLDMLYKIFKENRTTNYGDAMQEASHFIKIGTFGKVYKILIIIAVLMIIISLLTTKKHFRKIIGKCYYNWLVAPLADINFKSFNKTERSTKDKELLDNIDFGDDNIHLGRKCYTGSGEGYTFKQYDFFDEYDEVCGRVLKLYGEGKAYDFVFQNDNLPYYFINHGMLELDADLGTGFSLFIDSEKASKKFVNSSVSDYIIELSKKYGNISIKHDGNSITVIYVINRETLKEDVDKRFTYNNDYKKIKSDLEFIKDISGILE